jgi:limonene-1,2-epoxide hydrolase
MKRTRHPVSRRTFTVSALTAFATLGLPRLALAQAATSTGKSIPPDVEKANIAIVNDFCAAFARKDLAKAVSLLADNCSYRPTQMRPAVVGKEQVLTTVKVFLERGAEFKVLKTVALGPLVLNERDDIIVMETGPSRTFHIAAGLFFVDNGKIVEWTDYVVR